VDLPQAQCARDPRHSNPSLKFKVPGPTNRVRFCIRRSISKLLPQRIYEVFLDSKQFSAFTGMPADIRREAGSAFSVFGGMIVGRNVALIPNQRIVQVWRPPVGTPASTRS
jgi:activator of HSP90 ATPase